ncbi:MAG: hypothetical protein WC763_01210 [Candidatus Paceibacterota bacterium]|jgi:hypothetical protein
MRGNVRVHQRKIIAKKRKRLLLVSLSIFFAVALVVTGFAFLSHAGFVTIGEVSVAGNKRLSETYITGIANTLLDGNYMYVFSRRADFLYPHNAISSALLGEPIIKSVDVGRDGLTALSISVEERQEVARFCSGKEGDSSQCFAVDENGFVFSPSDDSTMIAYRDSTTSDPLGKSLFGTPAEFKGIQFFLHELVTLGVDPREAVMGEAGYMTVILGGGGTLIIDTGDDLSSVLANISSILGDATIAKTQADFLSKLDYMRLDAGNKVFYKLKK